MLFGSSKTIHSSSSPWRLADLKYGRTRRSVAYVGVELSETCVRVACLRENRAGGFDWTQRHQFPMPTMPAEEPSPAWLDRVLANLGEGLPRPIEGDVTLATIALPMSWTQYQTTVGHDLDRLRQRSDALFQQSVFASDSAVSHWPVAGIDEQPPSQNSQFVTASTARRASCNVVAVTASVGYQVRSVLPHAVALTHASFALTGVDAQCVLWLDRTSALIAMRNTSGVGLARSLPALPAHLDSSELKTPGTFSSPSSVGPSIRSLDAYSLRPYLSDIAAEFERTAQYVARSEDSPRSEKPILIAGSLAGIDGVDEVLATQCNVPVATWAFQAGSRPTPASKPTQPPASPPQSTSSHPPSIRPDCDFASALSLAHATTRTSKQGYGR